MNNSISKYGSILTYLGVLPFWISATAIILNFEEDFALFALRGYGSVIVSFICGIHWAIAMKDGNYKTLWLLITSNIIALIAWSSILIYNPIIGLIFISFALVLLLYIDCNLYKEKQIDYWFIRMRWIATLIAVTPIIITIIILVLA